MILKIIYLLNGYVIYHVAAFRLKPVIIGILVRQTHFMEDIVFNAMSSFQLFSNHVVRQINLDKLVPKGMKLSEWNTRKAGIIAAEIESMFRYLNEQAAMRLGTYPVIYKQEIESRFNATINSAINSYQEKLINYCP